jgi:hypothetical protein
MLAALLAAYKTIVAATTDDDLPKLPLQVVQVMEPVMKSWGQSYDRELQRQH